MNVNDLVKGFWNLIGSSTQKGGLNSHLKNGSDIKSALSAVIPTLTEKKNNCLDKMNAELTSIGFSPDIKCDSEQDYHYLLDYVPKIFSFDMLYNGEKYIDTSRGIQEEAIRKPNSEEINEMREYNKYVYDYMHFAVIKLKLEALKRNIQDNKSYDLTTDQLAMLGF